MALLFRGSRCLLSGDLERPCMVARHIARVHRRRRNEYVFAIRRKLDRKFTSQQFYPRHLSTSRYTESGLGPYSANDIERIGLLGVIDTVFFHVLRPPTPRRRRVDRLAVNLQPLPHRQKALFHDRRDKSGRVRPDIQKQTSSARNLVAQGFDTLGIGKVVLCTFKTVVSETAADSPTLLPRMILLFIGLRACVIVFRGVEVAALSAGTMPPPIIGNYGIANRRFIIEPRQEFLASAYLFQNTPLPVSPDNIRLVPENKILSCGIFISSTKCSVTFPISLVITEYSKSE